MKSLETIDVGIGNRADWRDVIVAVSTAVDDAAYGKENRALSGSVTANDTPGALVAMVNGSAASVGTRITLASGALLTVNRDGSYSYDPNHKFDYLVSAATAAATGALDATATDSFTYSLDGGSTATVTVTVRGVDGAGDQLRGNAGDNTISGTEGNNVFNLSQGGNDTVYGGGGDDTFYFGAAFTLRDNIYGGGGTDTLVLQGNYNNAAIYQNDGVDFERVTLLSGSDTSFGDTSGAAYTYTLDFGLAYRQSGTMKINGAGLGANEHLYFNASTTSDFSLRIIGGAGSDRLSGGSANDSLFGGGGADVFRFEGNAGQDTIGDFTPGTDQIDLSFQFYQSYSEVMGHVHDVNGNAVIDLTNGAVTLYGVVKAQLQQNDFIYYNGQFAMPEHDPASAGARDHAVSADADATAGASLADMWHVL